MQATEVVTLWRDMRSQGVQLWLDGGWGVDALLGRQTREHADLDVVVTDQCQQLMVMMLEQQGFAHHTVHDTRPWNFVMRHADGRIVDFHIIVIADDGRGLYGPQDKQPDFYPASALRGQGCILQQQVRCTSAEFQIRAHSGYALREHDYQDMALLGEAYALPLLPCQQR